MNLRIFSLMLITFIFTISCKKEVAKMPEDNIIQQANAQEQQNAKQNVELTQMTFDEVEHDFGTINSGDKVDCVFTFTNTGDYDLIITNAHGSCGCTVPEYPKEPTKPGESGEIKVSFNSKGKSGEQTKTVTLAVNTENRKEVLKIKASINKE